MSCAVVSFFKSQVDGAACDFLRDVRREAQGPHARDEAGHVEPLVSADGAARRLDRPSTGLPDAHDVLNASLGELFPEVGE